MASSAPLLYPLLAGDEKSAQEKCCQDLVGTGTTGPVIIIIIIIISNIDIIDVEDDV